MDGQTDGQTDRGPMEGQTNGWADSATRNGRTVRQMKIQTKRFKDKQTDQWTDVCMDKETDRQKFTEKIQRQADRGKTY
jgi:hypothetical protein